MQESDLPGLVAKVLWAAFALGLVFGAIAQRTHFCTMGAVADIVNLGDWTRMRMWALAIGVAMIGFNAMVGLGWLKAENSIYAAPSLLWLSNLVGGLLFGIGMVLASGCGSKTLVRVGGGNLKSLVVLFVMAVAAYATLRGVVGVARVATIDQWRWACRRGRTCRRCWRMPPVRRARSWRCCLAAASAWPWSAWVLARPEGRQRRGAAWPAWASAP